MCVKAILAKLNEKARYALTAAQRDPSPVAPGDGGPLVVYYGTLRKIQTMNSLFRLAHNKALEILLHPPMQP